MLNPKRRRFVEEYLVDLNAAAAYRRAGYAARDDHVAAASAAKLLTIPDIADAVAAAQLERARRIGVDQDYVVTRLRAEAELTGEGASHSARVQALKLLGLHLGMFHETKRVVMSGDERKPIRAEVTHDIGDLLPTAAAARAYLESQLGRGLPAVRENGAAQPVDTPPAALEAGTVPAP